MKKILYCFIVALTQMGLAGCLASTTSPDAINCGPTQSLPIWQRPLACQGGN